MDVNARKRGKYWEYYFEIAKIGGKRRRITKGGFKTKKEALEFGAQAKAEYDNIGVTLIYLFKTLCVNGLRKKQK